MTRLPGGTPLRPRRGGDRYVESFLLLIATVGLLATAGSWLQQRFGFVGLAATELIVVAGPTLALAIGARLPPSALGLARARARSFAGAALVGAGGFYLVSAILEGAIERVAPLPPAVRAEMMRLIVPASGPRPLAIDLLVLAMLPATCEELVFRGALLGAWRPAGKVAAVAGAALAFGVFHLSLYKLVPTAALGVLAGAVAVRASSVLPAMVFHAVNNTLVVLLVRAGLEDPPPPTTPFGVLLCAASLGAVAVGLWMVQPAERSPAHPRYEG